MEKKVLEDIIAQLNKKISKEIPLTTTRRKVLEYLGMTLDYSIRGKVKISMYEYIEKMLSELPLDMNGSTKTPVVSHLFSINLEAKKLPKATAQLFHHLVVKLLYPSRRTIQDIQTAVAFVCTRVQAPDENDYKKQARVVQYLLCTMESTKSLGFKFNKRLWDSAVCTSPLFLILLDCFLTLVNY